MTNHSQSSSNQPFSSHNVVGVHYKVGKKIGEGSFGIIYEGMRAVCRTCLAITVNYQIGTNLLNNQAVAIKFEPRKSDAPQLRDEYRTYKIMAGSSALSATVYGCDNLTFLASLFT